MADQEKNSEQAPPRRFAIKTALVLVGALALQCAIIAAVFIFAGGPRDLHAEGRVGDQAGAEVQPVEIEVLRERFQNTRTGRAYLYDTEIYIVTQRSYEQELEERIASKRARSSVG